MKTNSLILSGLICLSLNGCVVAAVADLAATTVVTAGKLAVKGTGALIDAAIPDKDDKDDDSKKKKKSTSSNPQQYDTDTMRQDTMPVEVSQPNSPPPCYITIDQAGNAYESTDTGNNP